MQQMSYVQNRSTNNHSIHTAIQIYVDWKHVKSMNHRRVIVKILSLFGADSVH